MDEDRSEELDRVVITQAICYANQAHTFTGTCSESSVPKPMSNDEVEEADEDRRILALFSEVCRSATCSSNGFMN